MSLATQSPPDLEPPTAVPGLTSPDAGASGGADQESAARDLAPGDVAPAAVAPGDLAVTDPEQPGLRTRLRRAVATIHRVSGLTSAGWLALAIGLAALIGFWCTHWVELAVVAILIGLLVLVALAFTIGRPRFAVDLVLPETRVVVGDHAGGSIEVTSTGRRRTLPTRLEVPVGPRTAAFPVGTLAPGATHAEGFRLPTERRTVLHLGPARSVQGDPFRLSGRVTDWTGETDVFVHPRTINLPGRQTGFVHDLEGYSTQVLTDSDMSFHALREYAPGDDRRHIHWRSSARTGALMVRQFEQTRQSQVVIGLDTALGSYVTDEEFELAVSVAGSVVIQCLREEHPVQLVTSTQTLPTVDVNRSLDGLSGVEARSGQNNLGVLARRIAQQHRTASLVVLVTGSTFSTRRLHQFGLPFDVDTRVILIGVQASEGRTHRRDERRAADPRPGTQRPGTQHAGTRRTLVQTVSNVTMMRLGALADLPSTLRRAM